LQDVLDQGNGHRMNFPGRSDGQWTWRFIWSDVNHGLAAKLYRLCELYQRLRLDENR
jgi:4-alpha-glucanotransferase